VSTNTSSNPYIKEEGIQTRPLPLFWAQRGYAPCYFSSVFLYIHTVYNFFW